jgi:predicted phage baseplate assembly protein
MTLPVPNLDDRHFQDLVDDAKRLVQRRCPEWTDHNVSDPGVTLIEAVAFVTDQLIYRLNRVPDRLYVKFLELIGVRLLPPTPAAAPLTFWLSAPPEEPLRLPASTQVATVRTEVDPAIVFATVKDLDLIPCSLQGVLTVGGGPDDPWVDRAAELARPGGFHCFSLTPASGESLIVALSEAVPSCAVRLRFRCTIEGVGVDPLHPPLAWEAWDETNWVPCEVDHDDTGGLNRDGDVVLHVPDSHRVAVFEGQRAGWLRARVTPVEEGQPPYSESPLILGLAAATVGGTVEAINAEIVENEDLGESEGVAGQQFALKRRPVLAGAGAPILETTSEEGWLAWTEVPDFAGSGPHDRHFVFDAVNGEILLGPTVREPDGRLRSFGAVPPKGAQLRMRFYAVGGGRQGNVAQKAISVLKSSIPYVARADNRTAAQGGVDGESVDEAKVRGPILLRTRSRAVTTEDFEQITREAAPEIARVRCLPAGEGADAGSVRVLVVPAAPSVRGRLSFEDLVPGENTLAAVAARLDASRLVGTRVLVEPPRYQGVTVIARLRSRPKASASRVEADALEALYSYLHPIAGGPDGQGWPFGRPVQSGEMYGILQQIPGVDLVEDVRIFGANPVTGERGQATARLELDQNWLVFSFEHQVLVDGG